ncbi:DUF551 domain-containing protein [Escherichia coli]|uniref:DUF551 domain-containing protein n=1 Tax=Escherichia coli TaxID=562 RepID=UPI000B7E8BCF|nr:DUF551 domain-containing protein [Escherichia coli]EFA8663682.1 DUF551 domain-containing protein [Escherichia coli]EFB4330749.1 DUF551 domain-containing protein [Escherichia coli]EFB4355595.1 DUF551 domain-containing protein [Escherichia coli]EFG3095470.1 DUF551 domain-containing protein [Escherichia coli]EFN5106161.1 DUF551 domain-containing protein [Escherichia coli]
MTTITRENAEIKSFITGFLSDPAHDNQSSDSLLANVFRIALASLEAEPVAWTATFTQIDNEYNTFTTMYSDKAEVERWVRLHEIGDFRAEITPLYAAPSAPVIPDGWISCSERMPNKLIPVMVMYEDGEMWSAMWNGNRWDDGTEYPDPHSVTHWREMPAAPQQEVK